MSSWVAAPISDATSETLRLSKPFAVNLAYSSSATELLSIFTAFVFDIPNVNEAAELAADVAELAAAVAEFDADVALDAAAVAEFADAVADDDAFDACVEAVDALVEAFDAWVEAVEALDADAVALLAAAVWLVVADAASTSNDHFALSVLVVNG